MTVGALLAVELIVLAAMSLFVAVLINTGAIPARLVEAAADQHAPTLRPYLRDSSADLEGVATWLRRFESTSITIQVFDMIPVHITEGELDIIVVGSDQHLLGLTLGFLEDARIGEPLDAGAIPGLAGPLEAALVGETDPDLLYTLVSADNRAVMTVPVWDATDERVLGVLVMSLAIPTTLSVLGDMVPILGVSALVFALVAGLAGSAFGFLAARGLVNRLDSLADAATAWRRGDFAVRVDDFSGDELGQLAQRLNYMANQLGDLMEARRQLVLADERNRMARELHHTAKQQAFAAGAQIGAARTLVTHDPEAAAARIAEAERLTYELRQGLTSVIQELRPAALEDKGLVPAVREFASDWSRQNQIALDVDIDGERSMPHDIEQTVLRIVQEALANVSRHSDARNAGVELAFTPSQFRCVIFDDGRGFEPGQNRPGVGLRSMRERADAVGGELTVESSVDQGTMVTLSLSIGHLVDREVNPDNG